MSTPKEASQARREKTSEARGRRAGLVREHSPSAERHLAMCPPEEPFYVRDPWRGLYVVSRWIGLPPSAWPVEVQEANLSLSEHASPDVRRALARLWR